MHRNESNPFPAAVKATDISSYFLHIIPPTNEPDVCPMPLYVDSIIVCMIDFI
jgi:hypothetical protein